jgi:hypothetical protein
MPERPKRRSAIPACSRLAIRSCWRLYTAMPGFRDVTVEAARVHRRFSSLAVAIQNVRDLLPEIRQLLMQATETERDAAWAEIEDALRQYDNTDEIVAPQMYLIGVGTK